MSMQAHHLKKIKIKMRIRRTHSFRHKQKKALGYSVAGDRDVWNGVTPLTTPNQATAELV